MDAIPFLWMLVIICGIVVALGAGLYWHHPFRDFLHSNANSINIVFMIGGALFAIWLYSSDATNNQIEATLEFAKKAETGDLRKAFDRINALWIRSDATEVLRKYRNELENTPDRKQRNELHKKFAQSVDEFIRTEMLEGEIMAIHGFYKNINNCVIQDRCHEPTACRHFAEDLQNFRITYIRFLRWWNDLWGTDVLRSLKGFCARCAKHLPPGEGRCSRPKHQHTSRTR